MVARDHRRVEVRHVPDPRTGRMLERSLVALVVDQEKSLILGEPSLVRVRTASIPRARQLNLFELVCNVHDRQRIFVGVEADFTVLIEGIGPAVKDTLRVVGVAVEAEAPGSSRRCGRADVDRVQAAFARARTDRIRKPGSTVDREIVRRAEARVVRGVRKVHRRRGHATKLRKVEDLHAVVNRLADDEGVIGEDLDVAPRRGGRSGRQAPEIHRLPRLRVTSQCAPARAGAPVGVEWADAARAVAVGP